ncbi:TonB-dependent heme/hemoglobin receptor family protein [Neokomagataea thailandica NBRC 106555]|uniref:TonB-dependent heme/hemoglobin receptor family protein n=1 Tax=Neokomagataea thailandica NBRC 106555 TaxID=1223520 RepID=A0ABQ0QSF7_9PROT|nr:TonB-dependent heme/hemoglobin receptor family protein [Neokomagataea thailandica NBRC 106555]
MGKVTVHAQAVAPVVPQSTYHQSRSDLHRVQPTEPYEILTGVPGVYFQNDGTPALAISMRGMQDFGRVNVMIDGARQNFQESGHGADGSVYVDPALLAGMDVQRGTVATADGAGAIAGVMNLHTLDVNDIVEAGKRYGVQARVLGGTNNYDGSGMVGAGARVNDWLAVAAAFSMRSSGDYEDGNGNRVARTFQRLQSGLFKVDITPGIDQTLKLGTVIYHNQFGVGASSVATANAVQNNTGNIEYRFTPHDNPLIALHVKGYVVSTGMDNYTPSFRALTVAAANLTKYNLTTLGFEADNTSLLRAGPVNIALNYGGEYYHDRVKTRDQTGYTGATPSGGRGVGSAFTQATFGWKIVQLTGALRYDAYRLSGGGVNEASAFTGVPVGSFYFKKRADAVNPKVTLAVNPLKGLQVYANYGLGFRPPATTETLYAGSHPGLGFLKFVPNPNLNPERTYGWEVGSKLHYADVLINHDTLNVTADYFNTRIKDYIAQTLVIGAPIGRSYIPTYGYFFKNLSGNTYTSGFESSVKYDTDRFFTSLSYTNTTTKLPSADYTGYSQMVTTPPRSVLNGTMGLHFWDKKVTIGARIRAASQTSGQPNTTTKIATMRSGYVVFDAFGDWQITKMVDMSLSASNITNRQYYSSALAAVPNQGLTVIGGLNFALSR